MVPIDLEVPVRYKLTFLAGTGVGYVLGTRAGRARYEQLSDIAAKVAATEPVQRARETAAEQASHLADVAKTTVGGKVGSAVAGGRHRVEDALGNRLPDRLRSTDPVVVVPDQPMTQTAPGAPNGAGAGI